MRYEKTEATTERYHESKRAYKKAVKKAKEDWAKEESEIINQIAKNPVAAWGAKKRLKRGLCDHWDTPKEMTGMQFNDGSVAKTVVENAGAVREHFEEEVFGLKSTYDH